MDSSGHHHAPVGLAIRLPTDATVYFVKNLFPLFTLQVSGSHKPIIRGISSCFFIYNHLVHMVFYVAHLRAPVDWFVVMVSLYWCHGGGTTTAPVQ